MCDLAIVGAGPSGLSAAINASSEGLSVRVIEPLSLGGSMLWSNAVENLAGFPKGITGHALSNRMHRQAKRFGARFTADKVQSFQSNPSGLSLQLESGRIIDCRSILLASGLSPRKLTVPGAQSFGVFEGANPAALAQWEGKRVALVGSGNSAGQAAVAFLRHGANVTLFSRHTVDATMSRYLIDRLRSSADIREHSAVDAIVPDGSKLSINGSDFDGVFSFVGSEPRHSFPVVCDPKGYVETDPTLATSTPGVFCAGDLRADNRAKRIATAIGEGATAVQSIHRYLNPVSGK